MIRNRRLTSPLVLIPALMGLFVLIFLGLKIVSALAAQPLKKYWSESGKCYIARYAPDYEAFGRVGQVIELFSSLSFYRVYTKDGVLLKTSEWYLWMREGNAGVGPEFRGEMVLYPGAQGWESWTVPPCR
ncbi:hypothetical protein FQ192_15925 [Pseudomonas sp. ANT_J12]|uniref:hypothetical protein n=1 Tax=Pseudomonas sp. ANT_J12 TaxID=2597351 RepID=UPI001254E5AE|nr:hypothetical protein [Pseudomonas sp. ANT_J12]KAA0988540.1 hypothetical protein FQ192_15925 [Pseudomonas sp. ANT_J12]